MARRIFLGSAKPLPAAVADRLAGMKDGTPPDLSGVLLVLPGQLARRSVRDGLLRAVPGGILLPQLLTPRLLINYGIPPVRRRPGPAAEDLLWGRALQIASETPEKFASVFPGGDFPSDKFRAAKNFRDLRGELTAGGFSIADAAGFLGPRGRELSELEKIYLREAERYGFADPLAEERMAVSETAAFSEVEKIVLAGMPDMPRMLKSKLAAVDAAFPDRIEIWIGSDEADAGLYDEWGAAIPEKWIGRPFSCPISSLHTASDPEDGARRAVRIAGRGGTFDPDECAVVLADPSLYRDFAAEFSKLRTADGKKLTVADPSGVPFHALRLFRLGEKLINFLGGGSDFLYASELLRERDFLIFCAGSPENGRKLLTELDLFQQEFTPDDIDEVRKKAAGDARFSAFLLPALKKLDCWKEKFERLSPAPFLREFFSAVCRDNPESAEKCQDVPFGSECIFLHEALETLDELPEALVRKCGKLRTLEVFWKNLRDSKINIPRPPGAVTFEGCLEMPFLDRRRIVFCGMNEGFFPDRIDLTPFLTDTLRRKIGLRSNRDTLARAICHLTGAWACRENGDADFIILRRGSDSSALRPSGILFGGDGLPEDTLLKRCEYLFREPEPLAPDDPGDGGGCFKLAPRLDYRRGEDGETPRLSVTDLDAYLRSPFTFFWERVKKASPVDYSACEPDDRVGGILCHQAFEALGGRQFASCDELRGALISAFDGVMSRRYGELPVLVKLFADNMKQRLEFAAPWLWKEQEEGFGVLAAEYRFGGEAGALDYAGAVFSGTIDRIEYDPARRRLRIIDIKTGKVESPDKEHCRTVGGETVFSRLQLPLYVLLLKIDPAFRKICPQIDDCRIDCGYLRMPRSVTDTSLQIWDADELAAILPAAEAEVRRIVGEIRELPRQMIHGEPKKFTDPLFLPDTAGAVTGVKWIAPGGSLTGETAAKELSPLAPPRAEAVAGMHFPAVRHENGAGETRCCSCPPEIQANCGCRRGQCGSCGAFNGFKAFNIITASAGTGKTYSLAGRFIQLMSFGVPPESILAITFTRKAAGEIFDKIAGRIVDMIRRPERRENRCLRQGRDGAGMILRRLLAPEGRELQISTIDSFFSRLLKACAPEFGIWGEINMIDENDDRFMRGALREWISSIHDERQLDALREMLKNANADEQRSFHESLSKLISEVYPYYLLHLERSPDGGMPQLEYLPWRPDAHDVMTPEKLTENTAAITAAADELEEKAEFQQNKNRAKTMRSCAGRMRELSENLEKSRGGFLFGRLPDPVKDLLKSVNDANAPSWCDEDDGAPLNYSKSFEFPPHCAPLLRRAARHIRALSFLQMRQKNAAVFELMSRFDRIYSDLVRSAGNLTFTDLPCLLRAMDPDSREMILGPSDHSLEFRLDAAIDHYLFDEFQDTSDAQYMAFDPLLRELFSHADTDKFRSFFCVGDIKQSIYQWRGGDPALFNFVAEQLKPLAEEQGYDPVDSLSVSYRSSQKILDAVNAFFAPFNGEHKYFPQVLEMMKFIPHVSADGGLSGHTAILEVPPFKRTAQNIPAKARIMIGMIREMRPFDRGLTVGVLTRTNSTARAVAEELRKAGDVPVSVESRITPDESMAFNVFRELLVLAEHPGDAEAAAFLEAVRFSGGNGPEISGMSGIGKKLGFPPGAPLDEAVRKELFFHGLGGFAGRFCEAFADECGGFDRERLRIMRRAAAEFTGPPDEFIRRIKYMGDNGSSLKKTVQIMTYHKSKGLEFDIVFLPDTADPPGHKVVLTPESEAVGAGDAFSGGMRTPAWVSYLPVEAISRNIRPFRENMEKQALAAAFEKYCNLYVAMTRARRALYFLTSSAKDSEDAPDQLIMERLMPYGCDPADLEWAASFDTAVQGGGAPALRFSHGDRLWFAKEHPPDNAPKHDAAAPLPTALYREERISRASDEENTGHSSDMADILGGRDGRATGTAVHELFAKIEFVGDDFDPAAFCRQAGAAEAIPDAAEEIFIRALSPGSPIREKLRRPEGECEVWLEKRFLLRNNAGECVPGAFDRVVIHRENGAVKRAEIWDYKSDRQPREEYFRMYFPQLASYRQSLSILLDLPQEHISCGIFALHPLKVIDFDV